MAETLDVAGELVTVSCDNHREELASGLWNFFQSSYAVDFVTQWGGRSILAHRLILDVFLSPEKLGPSARGAQPEKPSGSGLDRQSCLASLVEFLYTGKVTIHKGQLPNLLEAARESDFKMLVEAVELTTAKMASEEAELAYIATVMKEKQIPVDKVALGSAEDHRIEWLKEKPKAVDTNHEDYLFLHQQMEETEVVDAEVDAAPAVKVEATPAVAGSEDHIQWPDEEPEAVDTNHEDYLFLHQQMEETEFVDADVDAAPVVKVEPTVAVSVVQCDAGVIGSIQADDHSPLPTSNPRISNDKKKFKCGHCDKQFRRRRNLKKHERIHNNKPSSVRPEPFAFLASITDHVQLNRSDVSLPGQRIQPQSNLTRAENTYICSVCGKSFQKASRLKRHKVIHKGTENNRCHVCLRSLKKVTRLKRYMASHKGPKDHRCHVCSETLKKVMRLKRYMTTHKVTRHYLCNVCSESFARKQGLINHLRSHFGDLSRQVIVQQGTSAVVASTSSGTSNAEVGVSHDCKTCGKKMTSARKLHLHLRTHVYPTTFDKMLKDSLRLKMQALPAKTTVVPVIPTPAQSSEHVDAEAGSGRPDEDEPEVIEDASFEPIISRCNVCLKTFSNYWTLRSHSSVHVGVDKTFRCSICEKTFDSRVLLIRHMRRKHIGERPF